MKYLTYSVAMFAALLVGCGKDTERIIERIEVRDSNGASARITEAKVEEAFAKSFEGTLFPSLIYSYEGALQYEEFRERVGKETGTDVFPLSLKFNSDKEFRGKFRIKETKFVNETFHYFDVKQGDNTHKLLPSWKYDELIDIKKAGVTSFTVEVIDATSNVVLKEAKLNLPYRSINECVYGMTKSEDENDWFDTFFLFSAYVNEDSKVIDTFLSEALNFYNKDKDFLNKVSFSGYQLGKDYVKDQIKAIISYMQYKGVAYSDIVQTSNTTNKISSQYVRLPEETIGVMKANCVDGTVLLASALEKIGIETAFVTLQGIQSHMFLAYYEEIGGNPLYIETINLESNDDEQIFFKDMSSYMGHMQWRVKEDEIKLWKIKDLRKKGIRPIQ